MPIGHYTDYDLKPTCGLATEKEFIGRVDEPKYFMDPKRMDAEILWFTEGFIQYNIANFLQKDEKAAAVRNQLGDFLRISFFQ